MLTHVPVLLSAVLTHLNLHPNDNVVDATLGGGGHAAALLDAISPNGRLLGIEADERTLHQTKIQLQKFGDRCHLVHGNFRNIHDYVTSNAFGPVAGALLDLGLSSIALGDANRGFSFQLVGPLDMRFDPSTQTTTAADLVNESSPRQLTELFRNYGEEPRADAIAAIIAERRRTAPFTTTADLVDAVCSVKRRIGRAHPATQVFQALRIAVNDEFGALRDAMPGALSILHPGGRLAIITFHSLEDRIVKRWMKEEDKHGRLRLLTKHVIQPPRSEVLSNPRARSAKLRVAEKI